MRKEIETLALWYIPVYILTRVLSAVGANFLSDMMINKTIKTSTYFMWLSALIKYLDNLVIAIWLYFQSRRNSARKWIWAFFGVVAHFFAVVIFLALAIYEGKKETFNKGIETDAE